MFFFCQSKSKGYKCLLHFIKDWVKVVSVNMKSATLKIVFSAISLNKITKRLKCKKQENIMKIIFYLIKM